MNDNDETIENIFGFEDISETDTENEEVTVVENNNQGENTPANGQEAAAPKRKIIRKNIPKLDSNVLLSENGLIKLQTLLSKTSFKRGKGHEKENLSRLINVYQLWGHNLYPRLTFKSIIERTEKLCSEKRLRIAYSTWKEANRYKRKYETNEYNESGIIRNNDESSNTNTDNDINTNTTMNIDSINTVTTTTTINNNNNNNINNHDTFNLGMSSMSFFNNSSQDNNTSSHPPLSRLSHPLTEEERAFIKANRERALQKLRQKKEALERQRQQQQQQQEQQEQQEQQPLSI
ncbi:Swi3-domain-containing protein [Anaeromyces robustus]|uniref:Chromosome segregation in meiosis protein n=1 Tax=Anaeromyces robustus TaxID=1754192 RepID=A0A1Y1XA13_9FUNG|nr:Swi3-domain-containing protein [Anaeromyces robustus]|eukprot:ORX82184.1 Swi3-domain-containing protein [Anaeromyces robustus]